MGSFTAFRMTYNLVENGFVRSAISRNKCTAVPEYQANKQALCIRKVLVEYIQISPNVRIARIKNKSAEE